MSSKVVFITGGTGMIGLAVIEEIIRTQHGWTVHILYRKANATLDQLLAKYPSDNEIIFAQGDITDIESLRKHVPQNADAFLHMAAATSQWSAENDMLVKVNVDGTNNVIKVCLEKSVKKLVYTSSIASYAPRNDSHITEQTRKLGLQHVSFYNKTKYWSELLVIKASKEQNLPACILNPCQVLGKYDTGSWVQFFHAVIDKTVPVMGRGGGCFASVKEVAKAHIAAIDNGKICENYILGGPPRPFTDLAKEILRLQGETNHTLRVVPDWVLHYAAWALDWYSFLWSRRKPIITPEIAMRLTTKYTVDCSKARRDLGYDDAVPFETLVEEEYNWVLDPVV